MRLPIILATLLTLFANSVIAQDLTWQTEGVVFTDPTIQNTEVVSLPDGRWRMYLQQGTEIKSAISTDGKSFTPESGTRLTGSAPAFVTLPDGRWRMYFGSQNAIYSAVSSDGLNWSAEADPRLTPGGTSDPDGAAHPTVIALSTGGYRMYYNGEVRQTEQEFTWRILSASSADGLVWTKDPGIRINIDEPPLAAETIGSAHAEYYPLTETYELYFAVAGNIYRATSADGLLFTISAEPQLASEAGSDYQDPFILNLTEGKRMYYRSEGEGIYFADLKETGPAPTTTAPNWWEQIRERLPEIRIPANWELYIVPAILLLGGTGAVIFLLRSRRHH